jgi:predicted dithiol-disulfide oxidoreductase (DUF899 family)
MAMPRVGTQEEWQAARSRLQAKEDMLLEAHDAVVNERRQLPMVEVTRNYVFEGSAGLIGLPNMFDGRRQLLLYRFWFPPDEEPCPGCSRWVRNLGDLEALHAQDVSLVMVSHAPSTRLEAVRKARGWTSVPWFSAVDDDFDAETGYTGTAQITAFLRDNNRIFRTYSTEGRVLETITNYWTLMDLTPLGYR